MKDVEVRRRIEEVGLVPVVRVESAEQAIRAAEALFEGGIPIFEVTLTVPGSLEVMRALSQRFGASALVGAGTVLTEADVRACVDAGARFIVSPGLDVPTVLAAKALGVACMPGAFTPTEVLAAHKAGASMVKIFPCSAAGGPAYLRALRGPLPQIPLLPTGGITLGTAAAYVKAGARALGVGTELVDAKLDSAELSARARAFVNVLAEARAGA